MILVAEPEAAAIYTARYLRELSGDDILKASAHKSHIAADGTNEERQNGESFVLCDAGGGTVVRTLSQEHVFLN